MREKNFLLFLSVFSSMNCFSKSSAMYSVNRWLERLEYLSRGVGLIWFLFDCMTCKISLINSKRSRFCAILDFFDDFVKQN